MEINLNQPEYDQVHLQTTRVRFHHILVAIDFSRHSHAALQAAIVLAKHFDSSLLLFNAISPIIYGAGFEPMMPEVLSANISAAKVRMEKEIATLPELQSIPHSSIFTEGSLLESLNLAVKKHKIDLIVAGSHGAHGLEKLLLGSTAESLLRQAACPVLIMGPHAKPLPELKSLILASDLTVDSLRSAQYAASLAEELQAQLTVMHVIPTTKSRQAQAELIDQAAKQLSQLLPADTANWCQPKIRVEHGETSQQIVHIARHEKADLIVHGVREHGIFADHEPWRTLTKVIQTAPCPVLTVRGHIHH